MSAGAVGNTLRDRLYPWLSATARAPRLIGFFAFSTCATIGVWMSFGGRFALAEPRYSSDFFDAQARSWIDGTWAISEKILGAEAIEVSGRTYMNYGPFPSLLRLPVVALTDSLDGRLSQPSLAIAWLVYVVAVGALWSRIRVLVRGSEPVTVGEAAFGACVVVAMTVGSVLVTSVSIPNVYNEAIAWGVALATSSLVLFLLLIDTWSRGLAIALCFSVTGTILSRVHLGVGLVLVLWAIAAILTLAKLARRPSARIAATIDRITHHAVSSQRETDDLGARSRAWALIAAVPTLAYVGVNFSRFGIPVSVPWSNYVLNRYSTLRTEALEAGGGSITGLRYVPTTLWNYIRPDGLSFSEVMPWVGSPRRSVTLLGDVVLGVSEPTSSWTATMPLLIVLAAAGMIVVCRPMRNKTSPLRVVRLPMIGTTAAVFIMLMFGGVSHRFLADALPLFVLMATTGSIILLGSCRGATKHILSICTVVLALWGVGVNAALSVENANLIWPATDRDRYEFVKRQYRNLETSLMTVTTVPPPAPLGTLAAVGNCEALLWSTGDKWAVLEGFVLDSRWTKEPWMKFYDIPIIGPSEFRDTVLCRRLLSVTSP